MFGGLKSTARSDRLLRSFTGYRKMNGTTSENGRACSEAKGPNPHPGPRYYFFFDGGFTRTRSVSVVLG